MHEARIASWRTNISILMRKRNIAASVYFILLLFTIALLAPVLANNKPLYLKYHNHIFFPALSGDEYADIISESGGNTIRIYFSEFKYSSTPGVKVVMPPVPFAPFESDYYNADYKSPGDEQVSVINGKEKTLSGFEKHLLGTGKRGEDLLSGLIHGTKISLTVGIVSMIIAGLIGIFMGSFAGYFGDEQLKLSRGKVFLIIAGLIPAWFYGFQLRTYFIADALQQSPFSFLFQLMLSVLIFFLVIAIFYFAGNMLNFLSYFKKNISFPVDSIISRIIEILISLPSLILIISIAAISRPSLVNLVLIIGLTSWTDIARLTRAEILRQKNLEYIQSAKSLGFNELRILFRHALPNALAPAMVAIAFGIASAILAE